MHGPHVSLFFFLKPGLAILVKLKYWSQEVISAKAHSKLTESILRLGLCLAVFTSGVITKFGTRATSTTLCTSHLYHDDALNVIE